MGDVCKETRRFAVSFVYGVFSVGLSGLEAYILVFRENGPSRSVTSYRLELDRVCWGVKT